MSYSQLDAKIVSPNHEVEKRQGYGQVI